MQIGEEDGGGVGVGGWGVETGTAYLTYAAQSTRSGRERGARRDRFGQTGTAWG